MEFIKHFHSGWAYLTILAIVVYTIITLVYATGKKAKNPIIQKIGFFTTMIVHVQMVLGLALWVYWIMNAGFDMKNPVTRLFSLEHPMMMIAGVIFVTISNAKLKKSDTVQMSTFIFALLSALCILSRVPWSIWFA